MFGFRDIDAYETNESEQRERTLNCMSSHISSEEWNFALINIDRDIMELYDKAQNAGIIIISSPYNFKQITATLTEFACTNFYDQSLLNCFEIVLDFLNPNKKYIEDAISTQTESKIDDSSQTKWQMTKYDKLLNSNAIIIINSLNCDYISIPRNVTDLSTTTQEMDEKWQTMSDFTAAGITQIGYLCNNGEIINGDALRQKPGKLFVHFDAAHFGKKYDWIKIPNERICAPDTKRWNVSWNQLDYNNSVFSSINDSICENISGHYFSAEFEISGKAYPIQDWSKKIDFENGKDIGYLCNDGNVIRGTVLKQQSKKIFVHFNVTAAASFGKTYEWLTIPNERICPPPKFQQIPVPTYDNYSYMNNPWGSNLPRSREEEDEDLRRAIAESLGQVYVPPQRHNFGTVMSRVNLDNLAAQIDEEPFEAKEEVTYEEALDILLNGECHFGLYDKKSNIWRTAVYMKHWKKVNQRIMIRFVTDDDSSYRIDKFLTIKDWPVNYISKDYQTFGVAERDLRDKSNVPKENIDAWVKRQNK